MFRYINQTFDGKLSKYHCLEHKDNSEVNRLVNIGFPTFHWFHLEYTLEHCTYRDELCSYLRETYESTKTEDFVLMCVFAATVLHYKKDLPSNCSILDKTNATHLFRIDQIRRDLHNLTFPGADTKSVTFWASLQSFIPCVNDTESFWF